MLLDNFYTILSSEQPDETTGTVLLELNPDHAIYLGHFPAHPVVPGVCLLQLIKESVENMRHQKMQYTQISSCKFLSAINPKDTPRISLILTMKRAEDNKLQLQAEGIARDEPFIKLKAVLIPQL